MRSQRVDRQREHRRLVAGTVLGLGVFLGSFTPMVPDLRNIIENALMMLFFVSGIFFDITDFPEPYKSILYINPMVSIIEAYRDVFMRSEWPDFQGLGIISVLSAILTVVGIRRLRKLDRRYPRYTL